MNNTMASDFPFPKRETAKPSWTANDAQLLAELILKKEHFDVVTRDPLRSLITTTWPFKMQSNSRLQAETENKLCDWLINHAETIRDLLQPFDSGVRPAQPEQGK